MAMIRTQVNSNTVRYGATALGGANPVKHLTMDNRGYRKVVLGAFNIPNKSGIVYPFLPQVEALFKPGSSFYNTLMDRKLKGECGHPSPLGMTLEQYLIRLQKTDPTRVAVHIVEIELCETKTDRGLPVVLVYGWVKPSGPYGPSLEKQLENPEENVSFSLRSLTDPIVVDGKMCKVVWCMITYDLVENQGIQYADKDQTLQLVNKDMNVRININAGLEELTPGVYFTPEHFEAAIRMANTGGLEDDSKSLAMIQTELGWNKVQVTDLRALNWVNGVSKRRY